MAVEFLELTPRGRGAIAVVGLRGEGVESHIDGLFKPFNGKPFASLKARSIVYGIWSSTGEDLIVVRAGEDAYEVQCHGSLAAVEAIKSDLVAVGAIESADRNSWVPSQNDHQAEIARAMESCQTQRTARHLLQQYQLWREPNLVDSSVISSAISFAKFGEKLTSPWRVVLCGLPNVGKSSLINALSGFERAIVHSTAGTTRDLVSQHTAIDGWPVELIDSAGIRKAENQIEKAGVAKAVETIESADLVIHVVDATEEDDFDSETSQHRAGLVVVNKADLCERPKMPDVTCPVVVVSAKTGEGIEHLLDAISEALVPEDPDSDQLIPVTETQREHLSTLRNKHRGTENTE